MGFCIDFRYMFKFIFKYRFWFYNIDRKFGFYGFLWVV